MLLYNLFAAILIIILGLLIRCIQRTQLHKVKKFIFSGCVGILLACTTLTILFLDAIAVGVIGLVPN